jgi:hypothetical protein
MDGDIHARYLKLACLSVCSFVAYTYRSDILTTLFIGDH